MRGLVGIGCAAALLWAGAAAAQSEDDVAPLDRAVFNLLDVDLGVVKTLDGRRATFSLAHHRHADSDGERVSGGGGESMVPMRVAAGVRRPARLRVEGVMCEAPLAVIGTVTRRVARVEVVNGDGLVTRLVRRRPPAGWGYRGRVIAALYPHSAAVREVRARLRSGKVVARVRPEPPESCPQP